MIRRVDPNTGPNEPGRELQTGVSERDDDLLWACYLGLRVLKRTCEVERVWGAAKTADRILDEIEDAHPEFVQRRKDLLPAGSPP